MSNTWSHHCYNNNVFTTLALNEICKTCGLSHAVQSLRYHGYTPKPIMPPQKTQERPLRQLAALFRPKRNDEQQHDYLDRAG